MWVVFRLSSVWFFNPAAHAAFMHVVFPTCAIMVMVMITLMLMDFKLFHAAGYDIKKR